MYSRTGGVHAAVTKHPTESDGPTYLRFILGFGRNQEEFSKRGKYILVSHNNALEVTS
jgi:hypothetical protein